MANSTFAFQLFLELFSPKYLWSELAESRDGGPMDKEDQLYAGSL